MSAGIIGVEFEDEDGIVKESLTEDTDEGSTPPLSEEGDEHPEATGLNTSWFGGSDSGGSKTVAGSLQRFDGMGRAWSQFLERLRPDNCFRAETPPTEENIAGAGGLCRVISPLITTLLLQSPGDEESKLKLAKKKLSTMRLLYQLTDSSNKHNRVPMVCTTQFDILSVLCNSILLTVNQKFRRLVEATGTLTPCDLSGGWMDQPQYYCEETEAVALEREDETRRLACLTLNNLSIPHENKAVMTLGPASNRLLGTLMQVVRTGVAESYLCIICLMNLSYLGDDDAADAVFYFSPRARQPEPIHTQDEKPPKPKPELIPRPSSALRSRSDSTIPASSNSLKRSTSLDASRQQRGRSPPVVRQRHHRKAASGLPPNFAGRLEDAYSPLEDPYSLLRTLERMMQTYAPFLLSKVLSVEGEAIRWAVGLMRNLTRSPKSASLLSGGEGRRARFLCRTEIPAIVATCLRQSPHGIIQWTKDSLEDLSLAVLCQLTRHAETREALRRQACVDQALRRVYEASRGMERGGIHEVRANMIRCALQAEDV